MFNKKSYLCIVGAPENNCGKDVRWADGDDFFTWIATERSPLGGLVVVRNNAYQDYGFIRFD